MGSAYIRPLEQSGIFLQYYKCRRNQVGMAFPFTDVVSGVPHIAGWAGQSLGSSRDTAVSIFSLHSGLPDTVFLLGRHHSEIHFCSLLLFGIGGLLLQ